MAVRAYNKSIGISAFKLRKVADLVRGRPVEEALNTLRFMISPSATVMSKTIASAAANAENELYLSPADLKIVEIYANEGPRLKRLRARARGRAARIIKRSSHVTVVVDEEEL